MLWNTEVVDMHLSKNIEFYNTKKWTLMYACLKNLLEIGRSQNGMQTVMAVWVKLTESNEGKGRFGVCKTKSKKGQHIRTVL